MSRYDIFYVIVILLTIIGILVFGSKGGAVLTLIAIPPIIEIAKKKPIKIQAFKISNYKKRIKRY